MNRKQLIPVFFILLVGVCILAGVFITQPLLLAVEGKPFLFPRDHWNHPDFQNESWYFSGNLRSVSGMNWGFQFTIIRHTPAFWLGRTMLLRAPGSFYLGHLAVTNLSEKEYAFAETGLIPFFSDASARDDSFLLSVRGLKAYGRQGNITLRAMKKDLGVSLELSPDKKPVLHGNKGYFFMSVDGEAMSYYHYSVSSLQTMGRITWKGREYAVKGKSWLDRNIGSGPLLKCIRGYDWFALRLDGHLEVMVALIRHLNGRIRRESYGTVIFPDGTSSNLDASDIQAVPLRFWTSPKTKAIYPVEWKIIIPPEELEITVRSLLDDHEFWTPKTTGIHYWEGPVQVSGKRNDSLLSGEGYMELTGYSEAIGGRM